MGQDHPAWPTDEDWDDADMIDLFFSCFSAPFFITILLPFRMRGQTGNTLSAHNEGVRYEEGKEGAHNRIDSKDERTIANNLEDAKRVEKKEKEEEEKKEQERLHPTNIAKSVSSPPRPC